MLSSLQVPEKKTVPKAVKVILEEVLENFIHFPSLYDYYIEDITRWREDINFIFEWQNNILRTSSASE